MIVTVGGLIGAGKSTLAKALAEKYNVPYISAGQVMRSMAEERGMSLEEFSEYAEKHPEVDKQIDKTYQKSITENCVLDGRLAAYFAEKPDLKIWLKATLDVRATRVAAREGMPLEEVREDIVKREKSERKRYREIYGIDLDDLSIYDLILNTGVFDKEATLETVTVALESFKRK